MTARSGIRQGKFIHFINHLHPVKISLNAIHLKNTWGLGGMSLVLVCLLMVTGALLLLVYQPFPNLAYDSIVSIETDYRFGKLVRAIHYFSANFLVVLASFHMLRVIFTLGYPGRRKSNWMIGICIIFLILFSCFTGYLLPWDQTAFWAVTICLHMLEYLPLVNYWPGALSQSQGVTQKTLQLFFTCHTTLIPLVMIPLMGIHFWKIRKAGGLVFENKALAGTIKKIRTNPHLLLREITTGLMLIALIMTLALFFSAPLGQMANAGLSPNPAKAPWYFAGLQELLLYFHPFVAVFIIPLVVVILLVTLPFLAKGEKNQGRWFLSTQAARAGCFSCLIACVTASGLVGLNEIAFDTLIPGMVQTGVFLLFPAVAVMIGSQFFLMKKFNLSQNEIIQSFIIFLTSGYLFLTMVGIWFRGKGMALILP